MAQANNDNGGPRVHRIRQLLSDVHQELWRHRETPTRPYQEGRRVLVEGGIQASVPVDLRRDHRRPGTRITRPYETIQGRNRRIGLYLVWFCRV